MLCSDKAHIVRCSSLQAIRSLRLAFHINSRSRRCLVSLSDNVSQRIHGRKYFSHAVLACLRTSCHDILFSRGKTSWGRTLAFGEFLAILCCCEYTHLTLTGQYFALPWGLAFQFISFGLGMPLYCLAFLLLGAGSREGPSLRITEPDAIAILTGFMTSVMVSFNVFFTQSPYSTAIWQFFPVYHALAQQIYLSFRPSRPESSPGNSVVQATYLVSFFISSYVHLATVLPLLSDPAALQDLFLPLISVGADASLEVGFKNLIKWDMILGMGALQLCTLWFAQSAKEFVGLLVANVVVGTMVGPGGAFASIMIWRESKFEPEASLLFRKG